MKCHAIKSKICKLIMATIMKNEKISHISMFHNVRKDNETLMDIYECHISELIDYIKYCQDIGMKFVSIDQLLSIKPSEAIQKYCVLTFDDGFSSIYELVSPMLEIKKIPFIVYITTSFIDKKNYLSSSQLKKLSLNPMCTIGMHSNSHKMFRFEKQDFLEKDFIICKNKITEIIGKKPIHYAFPYGSSYACSKKNCRIIRELGVRSIAMTKALKLRKCDIKNPYYLPRLDIPGYYNGNMRLQFRGLRIGDKND